MYGLMALGIALLFNVARIPNFAYGELIMLCGYVMVVLTGVIPFAAVLLAVLFTGIAASIAMERVAFRPVRGADATTLMITSFALSFLLQKTALLITKGETQGVSFPSFATKSVEVAGGPISYIDIGAAIGGGVVFLSLTLLMGKSLLGVQLRAAAENLEVARLVGVRVNRATDAAFVLSGIIVAVVAVFVVAKAGFVTPTIGLTPLLVAFVGSVLGGMDRLAGAAVGGFTLGVATVFLEAWLPDNVAPFRDAFIFSLVIAVLLVRPEGMLPRRWGRPRSVHLPSAGAAVGGVRGALTPRIRGYGARRRRTSRSVRDAIRIDLRQFVRRTWQLLSLTAVLAAATLMFEVLIPAATAPMLITVILVVGLSIFVGNSGVLSFGHASFMLIGGYTTALLVIPPNQKAIQIPGLPAFAADVTVAPEAAVLLGGLTAAAFAAIAGFPLMRLSGIQAAIGTLGLYIIAVTVLSRWTTFTNGYRGLFGVPTSTTTSSALVWAVLAVGLAVLFHASRVGIRLRATREGPAAAASIGVSVFANRWLALVTSAFVTGVGAGLYVNLVGLMNPQLFNLSFTFLTVAMLIIGGMKSITGAVVGPVLLSALNETLRRLSEGFHLGSVEVPPLLGLPEIVLALVLLGVMLARPRGLFGRAEIFWLPRGLWAWSSRPVPSAHASEPSTESRTPI